MVSWRTAHREDAYNTDFAQTPQLAYSRRNNEPIEAIRTDVRPRSSGLGPPATVFTQRRRPVFFATSPVPPSTDQFVGTTELRVVRLRGRPVFSHS